MKMMTMKEQLYRQHDKTWVRKFVNLPKTNDQWERRMFMDLVIEYATLIAQVKGGE